MPAINATLLSAEQLRKLLVLKRCHENTVMCLLASKSRMFYCPTCDQMVAMIEPTPSFRPAPWRSDVFKWR